LTPLKATETVRLTATVSPETATDKTVTWTTSDEAVATVDATGLVSALKVGIAEITATAADGSGASATCQITVEPTLAESMTITPETFSGVTGDTFVIEVTVLPENATEKSVVFTSDNEDVATIYDDGTVTVTGIGVAVITVEAMDGSGLTAECVVTGESDSDSVDIIFDDGTDSYDRNGSRYDIYNMNGMLLRKDADREYLNRLSGGIYIIRQGTRVTRIDIIK